MTATITTTITMMIVVVSPTEYIISSITHGAVPDGTVIVGDNLTVGVAKIKIICHM